MGVQTATGLIQTDSLGFTLMHEHVFTSTPGLKEAYPQTFDRAAVIDQIVGSLTEAKEHGVSTVVEPTPFDMGRDVEIVAEVSRRSGVNVVVSTGFYDVPKYFLATKSVDEAVDILERDVVEGVGHTGIRVGMIKARIEESLNGEYEYSLRACARLQRRTGLPLTVHTSSSPHRTGELACSVFEDEGVDPSRVVIGHAGDSTNLAYLRGILDRGFVIGMDRFGLGSLLGIDQRVEVVASLCEEGYAGQMILSHDCPCYAEILTPSVFASLGGGGSWKLTTVPEVVVPALRAAGVSDKAIDEMTREVPARLLDPA